MTGKTHQAGGILCCFLGYSILKSKGYLIGNIEPLLQVAIMYPFAIYGSTIQDLDHNKDSIPTKDVISVGINKVLHLSTPARKAEEKVGIKHRVTPLDIFDAKHRSWQTHSDLFLFFFIAVFITLLNSENQSVNILVIRMILTGLMLGVISHSILDTLTPEGIWSIIFVGINKVCKTKLPEKIHLVPSSKFFATDGLWERIVRYLINTINIIYLIYLIYLMQPYRFEFNFG